ncbi:CHASE3 domain-containing protein, partial [Bradyrhizobium genomosp. I (2014)]|uniref:CHASE3 domain-containing protein n=1 Tax=Bradyrhizobium genomosp. I (2014) TaxID=2683269 RepID=UPI00054F07FC
MTAEGQRRRTFWQILLFAAGLLVLTVISAGSVYLVNKAREDSKWVVHTIEVENQINTLLLEIRRAESGARGFLLTQGPDFLSDHEKAVAAIVPALDKLARQIGDNPAQRDSIEKLRAAIEIRLDQFSREMTFVKEGQPGNASALVREAAAGNTTTTISNQANAMIREEERLFRVRTANSDRSQTLAASMTGIGSGLVVLLALISTWLVRRSARARDEAEARLRDANFNLEAIVDERTADLREANDEIQRFAYIVSHDLRSPLVNIMGFTSELEELSGDIFRRIGRP